MSAGDGSVLTESSTAVLVQQVVQQVAVLEQPQFRQDGSSGMYRNIDWHHVLQFLTTFVSSLTDYPYIIIADPKKPEQNGGFEIHELHGIEYRNYKRDAIHIRHSTVVSTEQDWDAVIPFKYPTLSHRSVLIRGPSQDFWHQSAERYHQLNFCQATKTVHETHETDLRNNPERKISHWLIVFPEGIEWENHVFSEDATHITKETVDMVESVKLNEGDKDEEETVELLGSGVYWRIAKKGGSMIRSPKVARRKRFAQRGSAKATT